MAIIVTCTCGQLFKVKEEIAGRRVKCSKCGQVQVVPGHPVPAGAAKEVSSVPVERPHLARQPEPAIPRIASQVGSLVAVTTLFQSGGWLLLGRSHQLPFAWFRRLIYDKLGWVGLGMFFDDSLAFILHGATAPQKMDASLIQGSLRIPPGAAAAVQTASVAGFLTTPIEKCLELKRFQISFRDYPQPTLRGFLLAPVAWLAIVYLSIGLLLPVWGVKWICRCFPSFRGRLARWYPDSAGWSQLVIFALLWMAGLTAGMFCITLFLYTLLWPPLFLRLLAKTGDYVLFTANSLIFYSSFYQTATQVPRSWPLLKGPFGKYFAILGDCQVCVARLPATWAEGQDLNIERPGKFFVRKLHAKARLLNAQVQGQKGRGP